MPRTLLDGLRNDALDAAGAAMSFRARLDRLAGPLPVEVRDALERFAAEVGPICLAGRRLQRTLAPHCSARPPTKAV